MPRPITLYLRAIFSLIACLLIGQSTRVFSSELACYGEGKYNLMRDLLIVDYWNQRLNERLPVMYNHLLQGGYFNMPSARMGTEGEIGFGYSYVPPYSNYNLRFQLIDRVEISGNYRIFKGVKDPVLGHLGFGDFSDKGANVKLSLFRPEDSRYQLPGIAIGLEDFIGTRAFKSQYVVLTQVFLDYHLEVSLGYGVHRIRGLFGGLSWLPFRCSEWEYLRNFSVAVEYDSIPYKDETIERHPKGRKKKSPINIGIKYRLWDSIDLSLSYIRGDAIAFSASTYFNFGYTEGMMPKLEDPLTYQAPINTQCLSSWRPEDAMVQDFVCAMQDQGFKILDIWLGYDENCKKTLQIQVVNLIYREERHVRNRLNALLASITPEDIDAVIVIIDTDVVPVQQYYYDMTFVRLYEAEEIGTYELNILTPLEEAKTPDFCRFSLLYKKRRDLWNLEILPKTHTLFGSSRGKFKYALGLSVNLNGYFYQEVYYTISLGYFIWSNLKNVDDIDRLNPSQLINVRTDIINYFKQKCITIDEAFVQKVWNLGNGWYYKTAVGLFEPEYGGLATECLYYPVNSSWAAGIESSILRKRTTTGIGFTNKVRKLHGFCPSHRRFIGAQYFLNLYYDWRCIDLEFKLSAGKFLANDYGTRCEVTRYFPSGLRLSFWYTYTNAHDKINGEIYHDKGVFLSMPLDIFYTKSSRSRWGYGMSAWLRDVGVRAYTGTELYYLISEQRQ